MRLTAPTRCLTISMQSPFANEKHRLDLKAQAQFLRAFYYYYLTNIWENIPVCLKTSSASDYPEQGNPDRMFTLIEDDLKQAIHNLPLTRPETEYGRRPAEPLMPCWLRLTPSIKSGMKPQNASIGLSRGMAKDCMTSLRTTATISANRPKTTANRSMRYSSQWRWAR